MKEHPWRLRFWVWWHCRVEYARNPILRWIGRRIYVVRRYLQGARRVACSAYSDTCGSYDAPGVDITFGGACPVQGEGTVDGRECYYRSRGEGWQFHVAAEGADDALGDEAWCYSERPYIFPDGGWVDAAVSRACIEKAVAKFRSKQ